MEAMPALPASICTTPEDRRISEQDLFEIHEKILDKTIADSFPAPISSEIV